MTHKVSEFDFRACADDVLADAERSVLRAHLTHYESAGVIEIRERLRRLYDLLATCVDKRRLAPIVAHAESIARDRFNAGFDLREVQVAINVLEETVWKRILADVPPAELANALGLVSTVLGAAKDALAREYVTLASETRSPSLNLMALFDGTGRGPDEVWR
ncbi:MAG: hypothetical protein ACKVU1_14095 [bacterium]